MKKNKKKEKESREGRKGGGTFIPVARHLWVDCGLIFPQLGGRVSHGHWPRDGARMESSLWEDTANVTAPVSAYSALKEKKYIESHCHHPRLPMRFSCKNCHNPTTLCFFSKGPAFCTVFFFTIFQQSSISGSAVATTQDETSPSSFSVPLPVFQKVCTKRLSWQSQRA